MSRSRSTLPTRGLRRLLLALHTLQQSVGRLVNAAPRSGVIAMPAPMLRTQSPPSGEFDYSKLEWAYDTRWGGCEAARIPLDRIQDLLAGERRRGACDLVVTHTDAANESSGSRAPAEGKLAKKTYLHCTPGPEDESEPSGALATSAPPRSGPGSRPNSKRQTGASIKRGCQVKFMWAPLAADSTTVEVRFYKHEHRNHGPGLFSDAPGYGSCPGRQSHINVAWLMGRMTLDEKIKPETLRKQNRERILAFHGIRDGPDADALLQKLHPQAYRDTLVTAGDIRHVRCNAHCGRASFQHFMSCSAGTCAASWTRRGGSCILRRKRAFAAFTLPTPTASSRTTRALRASTLAFGAPGSCSSS